MLHVMATEFHETQIIIFLRRTEATVQAQLQGGLLKIGMFFFWAHGASDDLATNFSTWSDGDEANVYYTPVIIS